MKPYAPRSIRPLSVLRHGDWDLKRYGVRAGSATIDEGRFASGIPLALAELPAPARTAERLGVGFLICHQTRDIDYLVLGWWDRENELPLRVFVREANAGHWRPARGSESVCVWDLEVVWAERQAYVEAILGEHGAAGRETYLQRTISHAGDARLRA